MIGSVTALQANQGNAAYAASKAALLAYARTLAIEVARTGVTVNYVAPGFIDTEMLAPYAKFRDTIEAQIPARRFARAGRDRRRGGIPDVARRVLPHRRGAAGRRRAFGGARGASVNSENNREFLAIFG